jgi:hypothetical protein
MGSSSSPKLILQLLTISWGILEFAKAGKVPKGARFSDLLAVWGVSVVETLTVTQL